MTGKEMCEKIAAELERRFGVKVKPEDIWNQSPTGEFFEVYALYWGLFPNEAPPEVRDAVNSGDGAGGSQS